MLASLSGVYQLWVPPKFLKTLRAHSSFFFLELSIKGISWIVDPREILESVAREIGKGTGAGCLCVMTWPISPKALKELEGFGILQNLKQVSCLFTISFRESHRAS